MKQLIISFIFLLTFSALTAKEIVVERPPFSVSNTQSLEIEKIVLNKKETVIVFTGYNQPGWWLRIVSDTYIVANGQKHTILSAQGIELDKEEFTDQEGKLYFSLIFPPIDPKTKQIDFIESDCEDCFKIWGIELQSKTLTNRVNIPDEIKKSTAIDLNDKTPLPVVGFKAGEATLKGTFAGYKPEMKFMAEIYANNPVTTEQENYPVRINEDGTFSVNIPVISTTSILLQIGQGRIYNNWVVVTPGEETFMFFDLQQKAMQDSRTRIDKAPESKWIYFGGANAELNNQSDITNKHIRTYFDFSKILNEIYEKDANEYKSYILGLKEQVINELKEEKLTRKAYDLANITADFQASYYLMMGDYMLKQAYRQKHKLSYEDELTGYVSPDFDITYFDFLKDGYSNNPLGLYLGDFSHRVSANSYIIFTLQPGGIRLDLNRIAPQLMETPGMTPEEIEFIKSSVAAEIAGNYELDPEKEQFSKEFYKKYEQEINNLHRGVSLQNAQKLLAEILGTNQGIAFEMMTMQNYAGKLEEANPLTEFDFKKISELNNPFYLSYATLLNDKLLAQIELNKSKKGYNVHEIPEVEEDLILHEIVKPFKGKVLFIDFWATWCGPCRTAMKQFEPAKEQFKGKDVVFIYLTDHSSPKGTWDNMIANIPGEHFRLEDAQFRYLKDKFGVKGIPSYLILGKEGEQVYFRTGFEGAETIANILNGELEK